MAEKVRCEICDRTFGNSDGLAAHNKAKHLESVPKEKKPFPIKKIRNWVIFIIVIGLIVWGIIALTPKYDITELNVNLEGKNLDIIPSGATHWHPHLSIKINGENYPIPANIGISIGRVSDAEVATDMGMAPTHTHDSGGTIHLENKNPRKKPETFALGYFFYIWDKNFDSTCIFEYCTDKGTLKMYINGEENTEFENYIMRDLDEILIEYTSNEN